MEFPELIIGDISIDKEVASFEYTVPDKEYNN